jgi:hypothetical protein
MKRFLTAEVKIDLAKEKRAVDTSSRHFGTSRAILQDFTGATGLEPATSGVTGRRSNQLNYAPGARLV